MVSPTANTIIEQLGLEPHPEGGWYRETWRSSKTDDGRPSATAIYYLLDTGERSHWHRVDADELWLWHAGHRLTLSIAADAADTPQEIVLGPQVSSSEVPQALVPAGHWQAAASPGEWALVSCVVSPGFEFSGFELAPPGWEPGAC